LDKKKGMSDSEVDGMHGELMNAPRIRQQTTSLSYLRSLIQSNKLESRQLKNYGQLYPK
jgi:hypothetical protein